MRPYALGAVALLLFLGLSPGLPAASQQTPPSAPTVPPTPPPPPPADQPAPAAVEAAPACSDCHELAASFTHNPHARGQLENGAVPNGVCETCHSGASEHAQSGDPTQVTVPKGRKGTDETCLMCHDRADGRRSHRAGMHANTEQVNCLSCHSVHHSEPAQTHLLRAAQPQLCATCHNTQAAEFRNKPFTHRIGHGGFGCTSCHEPHGRPGDSLRRTNFGEQACISCHSNLRGPFVFPHGAASFTYSHGLNSTGDCQSCHQPHGSNNPKMLKRATVAQLCLECHSNLGTEAVLGSQPPAFHNLNLPRYQNCTTCHVSVHGSNRSPALLK